MSAQQRNNVAWPAGASLVWLAVPLAMLWCIAETWTPFIVLLLIATAPHALLVTCDIVTWGLNAWRRPPVPQPRDGHIQVETCRGWTNRNSIYLYAPDGTAIEPVGGGLDGRAAQTLELRAAEGGGSERPSLTRYVMHVAHKCYGEGQTVIACIFSTCIDFAGGEPRLRTLWWFHDCSGRDADLSALAGQWPTLPAHDARPEEEWRRQYMACKRKAPRSEFWDTRIYASGHRVVRHGELAVGVHIVSPGDGVKTRIV